MNCQHQNNHCHECEKAKHWDFYFALLSIIAVIAMFYIAGWRAFIDFWPFWLMVGIIILSGLVVWWDKKKKREQEQKKKEENQTDKDQKTAEEEKNGENEKK